MNFKQNFTFLSKRKIVLNYLLRLGAVVSISSLSIMPCYAQSIADNKLPSMEDLISAMNQNLHKISNFEVRWIAVNATTPGFWDMRQKIDPRILMDGKEVHIQRSTGIFKEGKAFVDDDNQTVISQRTLDKHQKIWYDRERGIGAFLSVHEELFKTDDGASDEVVILNNGRPEGHVMGKIPVPFLALGRMQIAGSADANSSMKDRKAEIRGWETYHGLRCIKLVYGGADEFSGYVLVCPERDDPA